jgi:hypothetical protein
MTSAVPRKGMKLKTNDIIRVHGFVMLEGLDDGCCYRVKAITPYYGNPTYSFAKPKGRKTIVRHFASSVDLWVSEENDPDLNNITVEK